MTSSDIKTDELEKIIRESANLQDFTDQIHTTSNTKTVPDYLHELLTNKEITSQQIIQQINFSKSYYYKVLNGEKNPSRDILLQLAILLNCTIEETTKLLKYGKFAPLYVKDHRDAIIYFGLSKGLTLIEINHLLDDHNCHLLG